jgi:hypothetical protein
LTTAAGELLGTFAVYRSETWEPDEAERQAVAAAHAGWLDDSFVVPYLNRLADLVFTLARWQEGTFRPVRTPSDDPG